MCMSYVYKKNNNSLKLWMAMSIAVLFFIYVWHLSIVMANKNDITILL